MTKKRDRTKTRAFEIEASAYIENLRKRVSEQPLGHETVYSSQQVTTALRSLTEIERQIGTHQNKLHISYARSNGAKPGRRVCKTPDRVALATKMLEAGFSGLEIHQAIKNIAGPSIARSTYYLWQKRRLAADHDGRIAINQYYQLGR